MLLGVVAEGVCRSDVGGEFGIKASMVSNPTRVRDLLLDLSGVRDSGAARGTPAVQAYASRAAVRSQLVSGLGQ